MNAEYDFSVNGLELSYWPFKGYETYSPALVVKHCVNNKTWQAFRVRLKGLPTGRKLKLLADWRDTWLAGRDDEAVRTQIANYLAALRRGGQLDMDNRVKR